MKCQGCGVEKDPAVKETYPYTEDSIDTEEPVDPLFQLDCQPYQFGSGEPWKQVTVCHQCFHKLDPDMWISRKCWEAISPVIPFEQLPDLKVD